MLKNSRYLQVLTLKANDLTNEVIQPNAIDINFDEAALYYQEALQAGYTLYNVTAEGGFGNLATKAAGSYICAFTSQPTGSYTIASTSLSGTSGVAHTAIVVTSIILDATVFNPRSIGTMTVTGYTENVSYETMRFKYADVTLNATKTIATQKWSSLNIDRCYLTVSLSVAFNYIGTGTINWTNINVRSIVSGQTLQFEGGGPPNTINIQNFRAISTTAAPTLKFDLSSTSIFTIENAYVKFTGLAPTITIKRSLNASSGYLFRSCYFESSTINIDVINNKLYGPGGATNILYTSPTSNISTTDGSVCDMTIGYPSTTTVYVTGGRSNLDTTLVSTVTASSLYLEGRFTQRKVSLRGSYGTIRRQYYDIAFDPQTVIDDDLKNFDDLDRLVVNRSDLSTVLTAISASRVKGYAWFESGGTTRKYPRIDESFLFLATSGSNTHVLAYHKGEIRKTIFSDYWPTTLYTVGLCFQIWEFPEEVAYRNIYNVTDSPIEGGFSVQDLTSKVVL